MLAEDDIIAYSLNFRESIVEANEALTRTPFQRVYETWHFAQRKQATLGPLTPKRVADEFNSKVKLAKASEAVSEEYVSSCLIVYEKGFKLSEVREAVAWCDDQYGKGTPFDSVAKMKDIIKRCKDRPEKLIWIFQAIVDQLKSRKLTGKDLTEHMLFGKAAGKGWVDLWLFKCDMRRCLTRTGAALSSLSLSVEQITLLEKATQNFEGYRSTLSHYPAKAGDE